MGTSAGPGAFAALLQRHRLAAGLSQEQLAELASLSRRGISDLERGARRAPYPETVRRLAHALELAEADRLALLTAARGLDATDSVDRSPGLALGHAGPERAEPRHVPTAARQLPFVGREVELRRLEAAFEAAAAGYGGLIILAGEPGIGKTALCEQVARFAAARGAASLVGHCYPDASAGLPYQPFVEAFETYARGCGPDVVRAEAGSSLAAVGRMVPDMRRQLQIELTAPEDPAADRLRLLNGVLEFLGNIAYSHPLLLVLEDLHDADRGTLDLLVYLARHLSDTRLLVLGTYRDVDVDRKHGLAAALAELRRVSQFERIHVRELSADEVHQLLASTSQQPVSRALAEIVHRRSGGNALFAHELLRFLAGEGLVERRDGALRRVDEASFVGQMPEGLRDVVGKRLSRLSAMANQVLSTASVIGREFQLEVLRRVQTLPENELESAVEETVQAAILEERRIVGAEITYRFSHAFFQQMLSDEMLASRRIRLHRTIARVLEDVHARRLEEHAAELAEHYSYSSDAGDLLKAVHYGELAARRATDVFAYGEAERQLERALAVQELADADDYARRCDLLLALAESLFAGGETQRVVARVAPDALALAEALGDRGRAFRACRLAVDSLFAQGAGANAAQPEYLRWAERAVHYAEPESVECCLADLALAQARYSRREYHAARALQREALALARRHADPEALFSSVRTLISWGAPQHWRERLCLSEECAGWSRQGVTARTLGPALWWCGRVQLGEGARADAEELWRQVQELAQRTRVAAVSLFVARTDLTLAIVDGHLEEPLGLVRRYVERADQTGAPVLGRALGLLTLIAPALYLGRPDVWLTAFDEFAGPNRFIRPSVIQAQAGRPMAYFVGRNTSLAAARAICLAQLGRTDEAVRIVGPVLDHLDTESDDEVPDEGLALLLQAAVVLKNVAAARALGARLVSMAHLSNIGTTMNTCPGRHLGDAAVLVGHRAAARAYYAQALVAAEKICFRPERALTHVSLAELLLEEASHSARSEALEHLEAAIPELRAMNMQPALERALQLNIH